MLYTQTFGTGNSKGLWLHGWLGSGEEGAVLQASLGSSFSLKCPDLPGHGKTAMNGFSLSKTLEAIAGLSEDCAWTGGYSMGGRLLMMAAARFPDAFRNLIIESASLGFSDPEMRGLRRKKDEERADLLQRDGLEKFCESWYQMEMWGGLQDFPDRKGDEEALGRALEKFSVGVQPDLRLWLQTTSCRVLWLAGTRDAVYAEQADWVRKNTRHLISFFDCGHNVHHQAPKEWAQVIDDFLKGPLYLAEQ